MTNSIANCFENLKIEKEIVYHLVKNQEAFCTKLYIFIFIRTINNQKTMFLKLHYFDEASTTQHQKTYRN